MGVGRSEIVDLVKSQLKQAGFICDKATKSHLEFARQSSELLWQVDLRTHGTESDGGVYIDVVARRVSDAEDAYLVLARLDSMRDFSLIRWCNPFEMNSDIPEPEWRFKIAGVVVYALIRFTDNVRTVRELVELYRQHRLHDNHLSHAFAVQVRELA